MKLPTTVTIDMDKRCAECKQGGATDSGICLRCATKAMGTMPMRSPEGQAVQKRLRSIMGTGRPKR